MNSISPVTTRGSEVRASWVSPQVTVDPLFTNRWSPRSFERTGVTDAELRTLFEAARWAPSCFNDQPWQFFVAHSESALEKFRPILVDANRAWTDSVPVLAVLFARLNFSQNQKPNAWAPFDCGSAWMSLALQAQKIGLAAHAMAGFHEDRAYAACGVSPVTHKALCVIAIGKPLPQTQIPAEFRVRETPNSRKPLTDVFKLL